MMNIAHCVPLDLINVKPYMSESVFTVNQKFACRVVLGAFFIILLLCRFSIERMYVMFRTMGLRHLPVVNDDNEVVGMITRKVSWNTLTYCVFSNSTWCMRGS